MATNPKKIKVVELFAGVGGFRVGFEKADKERFDTVWFNQWEPGKKPQSQFAHHVYLHRWADARELPHTNTDIERVVREHFHELGGTLDHDLLVGGFPCQDYSVAKPLRQSSGLIGKKGVLWWSIVALVKQLQDTPGRTAPRFLLLENVDRLLKSPGNQRGRDFAIMLQSLETLGYDVEWRVINAADYGFPQRRRRVFILAYRRDTAISKAMRKAGQLEWLNHGTMADAFPIEEVTAPQVSERVLQEDEKVISDTFGVGEKVSWFQNAGVMIDGVMVTARVTAKGKEPKTLADILLTDEEVITKYGEEFFIDPEAEAKWKQQKDAKKIERTNKATGHVYTFSEGGMAFPDDVNKPARTIVTGEGGSGPSRFKHVVRHPNSKRLRRLVPEELELISMFPKRHTEKGYFEGETRDISPNARAFFIGNALVTGVVTKIGKELIRRIDEQGL
jgi:DNA (cytosine-5)-methyltransferase 1